MPIIHPHKIILVHIPKTGGQSIYKPFGFVKKHDNLWGEVGNYDQSHFTAKEIRNRVSYDIFNGYLKVAVVRNPFDRLVSEYFYKRVGDTRLINVKKKSFEDFIYELQNIDLSKYTQRESSHFKPQNEFIFENYSGATISIRLVDKIFRYENFKDVKHFIKELTGQDTPWLNRTKHNHYRSYYNLKTREIVGNIYKKDLELFDYRF